jgi:hypothetical protein
LKTRQQTTRDLLFNGARISFLAVVAVIFLGGLADWAYLNVQEFSITIASAFVEYLASYASAFLIAGIEIAAAYYFIRKYDLGNTRRLFLLSIILGALGFVIYVIGEVFAGLFSFGNTPPSLGQVLASEISPYDLDYGNALIILLSIFSLVFLVGILIRINPPMNLNKTLPNGTGFFGGVWTSTITTVAAMVCCGPLPGAIALATGISSVYFTDLINYQSILVLVSVPLLLYAIVLANRRAMKGCRLRLH